PRTTQKQAPDEKESILLRARLRTGGSYSFDLLDEFGPGEPIALLLAGSVLSLRTPASPTAVCRSGACAVAQGCLVLWGGSRARWKKAGKTIRLPSSERSEGTTGCGGSDVRPSVTGR